MWRVVVLIEQRESGYSAFEPRYSKGTDDGREERKGGEGHFQLGNGGTRVETDIGLVLLASACSLGSQAALRSTRAIPRSRVACGAFNVEFIAIWVLWGGGFGRLKRAFSKILSVRHIERSD